MTFQTGWLLVKCGFNGLGNGLGGFSKHRYNQIMATTKRLVIYGICDEHGELVKSQGRSTHKPKDFDHSLIASGHGPLLGGFDLIETTTVTTSVEHYYR